MAIQISGCTVIDNSRNITNANNMCVGAVTMTGSSGDIETPGTITAGGIDFPLSVVSFSPTDGATNVEPNTNIVIAFDQLVQKGTGNITLRNGSASGTILQTISVTSTSVTINGSIVTIVPPSLLLYSTNVYVVVDAGAFNSSGGNSPLINTYSFTIRALALGDSYEGGYLICQASSLRWVVAPNTSEVSRNWYSRNDANTRAQQVSGCTGWFVPTRGQLQNPGYTCRTYWDSYSSTLYWSSTEDDSLFACPVCLANGSEYLGSKTDSFCVRAFRCVTY
jgi:hypothetical protein